MKPERKPFFSCVIQQHEDSPKSLLCIALEDVVSVVSVLGTNSVEMNGEKVEVSVSAQLVMKGAADNVVLVNQQAARFLVVWAAFTQDDALVEAVEPVEEELLGPENFAPIKRKRDEDRASKIRAQTLSMTADECEAIDQALANENVLPTLLGKVFYQPDDEDREFERRNPALRVAYLALRMLNPQGPMTGVEEDLKSFIDRAGEVRLAARRTIAMVRQGQL